MKDTNNSQFWRKDTTADPVAIESRLIKYSEQLHVSDLVTQRKFSNSNKCSKFFKLLTDNTLS